jgi:hypothetical protein
MNVLIVLLAPVLGAPGVSEQGTAHVKPAPKTPAAPHRPANDERWRRTVRGWEKSNHWPTATTTRADLPALAVVHPAIVACFQFFISLAALLVFPARDRRYSSSSHAVPDGPEQRPPLTQ